MNLGLSLLELGKILMYEFWYDYIKLNIGNKQNYAIWLHHTHKNRQYL